MPPIPAHCAMALLVAFCGCVADSEPEIEKPLPGYVSVPELAPAIPGGDSLAAAFNPDTEKRFLGAITGLVPAGAGSYAASASFTHAGNRRFALDVINGQSGQTLATEEILDVDGQDVSRTVQFRHEGNAKDLEIVLRETQSGAVVDRWNPR